MLSPPPRPLRVLVVDDNIDAADSLTMVLRFSGYRANAVYNGPRALVAAAAEPPDLILLDLAMPLMNGHEVVRNLKADAVLEDVPVIMITGNATETERQKALGAGCLAFLAKPVDFAELGTLLVEVMRS
jgi:CheY-like chemotaxis protein